MANDDQTPTEVGENEEIDGADHSSDSDMSERDETPSRPSITKPSMQNDQTSAERQQGGDSTVDTSDTPDRLLQVPTPPKHISQTVIDEIDEMDIGELDTLSEYVSRLATRRRQIKERQMDSVERPDEVPEKAFLVTKTIRDTDYIYWQWYSSEKEGSKNKLAGKAEDIRDPVVEDTDPTNR